MGASSSNSLSFTGRIPHHEQILKMDRPGSSVDSANMPKRLRAQLCRILLLFTKIWGELDNTWFSVAWMTLREEDQKNHMLNGVRRRESTPP